MFSVREIGVASHPHCRYHLVHHFPRIGPILSATPLLRYTGGSTIVRLTNSLQLTFASRRRIFIVSYYTYANGNECPIGYTLQSAYILFVHILIVKETLENRSHDKPERSFLGGIFQYRKCTFQTTSDFQASTFSSSTRASNRFLKYATVLNFSD